MVSRKKIDLSAVRLPRHGLHEMRVSHSAKRSATDGFHDGEVSGLWSDLRAAEVRKSNILLGGT